MKIQGSENPRCLFIDGPVAVYLSDAPEVEIIESYERLGKVIVVAARLMQPGRSHGGIEGETPVEMVQRMQDDMQRERERLYSFTPKDL